MLQKNPARYWWWLSVSIALIALSSTSASASVGDYFFDRIYNKSFLGSSEIGGSLHHIVYIAAEKGVHLCLFFTLGFVLSSPLHRLRRRPSPILALVACTIIGAASEALQTLAPNRDPQLTDVAINISGSVLGIIAQARMAARHLKTAG